MLGLSLACLLLLFFIFKVQCYLDRRNNDVAVAAATAQGLNQSAVALQMFPVLVYSDSQKKNHHTAAGTEKKECAICLIEFRGGDKLTLLPCKHFYHPRCVAKEFGVELL
ncbi:RING-H2 finger protein ATL28-like [Papaver somniferum]|uniref:RING-H2 finger protein ATL28-like n=1 Tax=Papaver somniferum TaxID=3469 RepID=UPI000E6FF3DA|nr:RING-H2 finger protein ATL28-like [Papaver somniferum]